MNELFTRKLIEKRNKEKNPAKNTKKSSSKDELFLIYEHDLDSQSL
jgi:hypothetical protein